MKQGDLPVADYADQQQEEFDPDFTSEEIIQTEEILHENVSYELPYKFKTILISNIMF
jgi:hypothetical protein